MCIRDRDRSARDARSVSVGKTVRFSEDENDEAGPTAGSGARGRDEAKSKRWRVDEQPWGR
eukprot:7730095-Alexandrium_andersonii.AAC.1